MDGLIDKKQLSSLTALINKMTKLEDQVAKTEERLKQQKEELREMSEKTIPDFLLELGINQLTLGEGEDATKISVSQYYSAKIPANREAEAFEWLRCNGHDALIKSKVDCSFGKGEEETRQETAVVRFLESNGIPFKNKRSVHPMTLKAFVKEQIESGEHFPQDLFGVYIGNKTKVRR